jgi:hypothetical protein
MFNANAVVTSRFNSLHGIAGAIVNNWEVGPLLRITDGDPFNVIEGDISGDDVTNDRPNLTGSAVYTGNDLAQSQQYINNNAFAFSADGTYGTLGRNAFRGPKYVNLDAEISRFFPITERTKLDFRIEAFNAMNHPNFKVPSSSQLSITSTTFGQITSANDPRIWQGAVKFIF